MGNFMATTETMHAPSNIAWFHAVDLHGISSAALVIYYLARGHCYPQSFHSIVEVLGPACQNLNSIPVFS